MKVNSAKLFCRLRAKMATTIKLPKRKEVISGFKLKILGFNFCVPSEQAQAMLREYFSCLWLFKHSIKAGLPILHVLDLL